MNAWFILPVHLPHQAFDAVAVHRPFEISLWNNHGHLCRHAFLQFRFEPRQPEGKLTEAIAFFNQHFYQLAADEALGFGKCFGHGVKVLVNYDWMTTAYFNWQIKPVLNKFDSLKCNQDKQLSYRDHWFWYLNTVRSYPENIFSYPDGIKNRNINKIGHLGSWIHKNEEF